MKASLTLYFSLSTRISPSSTTFNRPSNRLIIETTTLAVPILFGLTISAERPLWLTLSALVGAFMLSFQPRYTTFISPKRRDSMRLPQTPTTPTSQIPFPILPLQSLTVYRANMMLLTAICILAVDFPAFPRMLAKCETWGASMVCSVLLYATACFFTNCFRWTLAWGRSSFLRVSSRPFRSSRTHLTLQPRSAPNS